MIEEDAINERGLLEGADRIIKELLKTPRIKESLVILLQSLDPPAARGLVRTLLWEDPVLAMSVFGALPTIVNVLLEAAAEAMAQLGKLPAPLLTDFAERLVAEVDAVALGEAVGGLVSLLLLLEMGGDDGLGQSMRSKMGDLQEAYSSTAGNNLLAGRMDWWVARMAEQAGREGSATNSIIRAASEAIARNPDFTENVLHPLLATALEAPPAKKAVQKKPSPKQAGGAAKKG